MHGHHIKTTIFALEMVTLIVVQSQNRKKNIHTSCIFKIFGGDIIKGFTTDHRNLTGFSCCLYGMVSLWVIKTYDLINEHIPTILSERGRYARSISEGMINDCWRKHSQ